MQSKFHHVLNKKHGSIVLLFFSSSHSTVTFGFFLFETNFTENYTVFQLHFCGTDHRPIFWLFNNQ